MQYTRKPQQYIKSLIIGAFLAVLFLPFVSSAQTASNEEALFGGKKQQTKQAIGVIGQSEKDPRDIAANIINVIFGFLGLLAVSLTLYAGYLWMTSQGQPEQIEKAKEILRNAAIGILIILSAYAIVIFIFRMFFGGGSMGGGGGAGGGARGVGIGALGNGIIVSMYPAPNQTDVPRNTAIMVTFREAILPSSICATDGVICNGELIATSSVGGGFVPNIRIYYTQNTKDCEVLDKEFADPVKQTACGKQFNAQVYSTGDNKTFVFKTTEYLGSPSEIIWHTVYLTKNIKKSNGQDAFRTYDGVRDTSWSFEVSNKLDLEPPTILGDALYPAPDNSADTELPKSNLAQAVGSVSVLGRLPNERLASIAKISTTSSVDNPQVVASSSIDPDCSESYIKVVVSLSSDGSQLLYSASSSTVKLGQGKLSDDNKSILFDICNLKLTPDPNPSFSFINKATAVGRFWEIDIDNYITPARLTIGNRIYTASTSDNMAVLAFDAGNTANDSAQKLSALINGDDEAGATSSRSGHVLTLKSKIYGEAGNDLQLASNMEDILAVTKFANGKEAQKEYTVKSRRDKPRNSLIQINFSEAMNPIPLTGSSSLVKDLIRIVSASSTATGSSTDCYANNGCKSLICHKSEGAKLADKGVCLGDYLPGVFKVSNQYRTVEFTSDHQCGVNGCGQKIYCLPGDANIKVEFVAANLDSSNDCARKSPYANFGKLVPLGFSLPSLAYEVCQTSSTTFPVNYPASKLGGVASPFDGQMDACFNSLDGNRDTSAEGQFSKEALSFYNENSTLGACDRSLKAQGKACSAELETGICGLGAICAGDEPVSEAKLRGDNYSYSFWTNNEILQGAPAISRLEDIGIQGTGVNMVKPAGLDFNRVMSISSLSSGRISAASGASTTEHRMLNMGAFSKAPVGYWGSAVGVDEPKDGEMDATNAYLNHTDFDPSTDYWSEAGSGIIDINQNCFKPSEGPKEDLSRGRCGTSQDSPSCCNGHPTDKTTCDVDLKITR